MQKSSKLHFSFIYILRICGMFYRINHCLTEQKTRTTENAVLVMCFSQKVFIVTEVIFSNFRKIFYSASAWELVIWLDLNFKKTRSNTNRFNTAHRTDS